MYWLSTYTDSWKTLLQASGRISLHYCPWRMSQKRAVLCSRLLVVGVCIFCKSASVFSSSANWLKGTSYEARCIGWEREGNVAGTGVMDIWTTSSCNLRIQGLLEPNLVYAASIWWLVLLCTPSFMGLWVRFQPVNDGQFSSTWCRKQRGLGEWQWFIINLTKWWLQLQLLVQVWFPCLSKWIHPLIPDMQLAIWQMLPFYTWWISMMFWVSWNYCFFRVSV